MGKWWMLLASWCCTALCQAQSLNVHLSREQILLGERTELVIRLLDVPATQGSGVKAWFAWPKNAGPVELLFASRIDTLEERGRRSFLQTLTLTGFDSGRHALPVMEAVVLANGVEKRFALPPLTVEVMPVNIQGMKTLHPPKPLLNLRPPAVLWWKKYGWWLVALGVMLLAALVVWLRRKKPVKKPVTTTLTPHSYQDLLTALEKENPADQAAWRDWAHRLDAAVRLALSQLASPALLVADHRHWPAHLQAPLANHLPAQQALTTYCTAMDPVQFGDRWPAFDQGIIAKVVKPLLAPLQAAEQARITPKTSAA